MAYPPHRRCPTLPRCPRSHPRHRNQRCPLIRRHPLSLRSRRHHPSLRRPTCRRFPRLRRCQPRLRRRQKRCPRHCPRRFQRSCRSNQRLEAFQKMRRYLPRRPRCRLNRSLLHWVDPFRSSRVRSCPRCKTRQSGVGRYSSRVSAGISGACGRKLRRVGFSGHAKARFLRCRNCSIDSLRGRGELKRF